MECGEHWWATIDKVLYETSMSALPVLFICCFNHCEALTWFQMFQHVPFSSACSVLSKNRWALPNRSKSIQIASPFVEEFARHHMTKSIKGFSLVMHVSYPEQDTTIFESAPLFGLGFTTCQEMSSHSIPRSACWVRDLEIDLLITQWPMPVWPMVSFNAEKNSSVLDSSS